MVTTDPSVTAAAEAIDGPGTTSAPGSDATHRRTDMSHLICVPCWTERLPDSKPGFEEATPGSECCWCHQATDTGIVIANAGGDLGQPSCKQHHEIHIAPPPEPEPEPDDPIDAAIELLIAEINSGAAAEHLNRAGWDDDGATVAENLAEWLAFRNDKGND